MRSLGGIALDCKGEKLEELRDAGVLDLKHVLHLSVPAPRSVQLSLVPVPLTLLSRRIGLGLGLRIKPSGFKSKGRQGIE